MDRMVVQHPSKAGEYRRRAAMLRSSAWRAQLMETRINLLALADSFEKLAKRVEAREKAMAPAAD